jgi:hypothetical protein
MIYIDKYFGAWRLLDGVGDHHWELLSNNANHTLDDFQVGHCYDDASVRDFGPFKEIGTDKAYVFPLKFQLGDQVLVLKSTLEKAEPANVRVRDRTYVVCEYQGATSGRGIVKVRTNFLVPGDQVID